MAFINLMRDSSRCAAEKTQKIIEAWTTLAPACGRDLRIIEREVRTGVAHLLCFDDEYFAVIRPECDIGELVIVAGAGKNCVKHTATIHQKAKLDGFITVRLHTLKPDAMLRMGRALGYQRAETIIRAEL